MFRRLQLSLFCPARNGIHEEDPSLRQDADQLRGVMVNAPAEMIAQKPF
jgi:hypothetical protein